MKLVIHLDNSGDLKVDRNYLGNVVTSGKQSSTVDERFIANQTKD